MGSVFKRKRKRKDGSEYEVWVCEDEYNGIPKTITAKSEREVKAKMKSWQKEMAQYGESLKKSNDTFKAYALKYYRTYKKGSLSDNSYRCYMTALDNHIFPVLGHKKLTDIKKTDIQEFFNSKSDYSSSTLNTMKIALSTIFDAALDDELIRQNPMSRKINIHSKKDKPTRDKAMTLEQQKLYIRALDDEPYRLIFLTLLYTGLRIGELMALTWNDYHDGVLSINKSVGRVYVYDDKGNRHIELKVHSTKNKIVRTVPMPSYLKSEFEIMRRTNDLIFHSRNGTYLDQGHLFRAQSRVCDNAGIPHFSLHDLRHTYATRLLELNKSPKVVQTLLGHSNIATTMNIYSHVFDSVKVEAVNDLRLL